MSVDSTSSDVTLIDKLFLLIRPYWKCLLRKICGFLSLYLFRLNKLITFSNSTDVTAARRRRCVQERIVRTVVV